VVFKDLQGLQVQLVLEVELQDNKGNKVIQVNKDSKETPDKMVRQVKLDLRLQ
jgi:hypothetical protein